MRINKTGLDRDQKAKLNIVMALFAQITTLICGLVIPQLMIANFGSEAYGATTSIAQFLGYISLLDGGMSGVARAALYKPLALNDTQAISNIVAQMKKFFRVIAFIFVAYVLLLAVSFKGISHTESLDWPFTFALVLVISISTFAQYFIGISYSVLLQAAQKGYIVNICSVITVLLNTVITIILVKVGCNLVMVKLVSSCIYVLRPIVFYLYVRAKFNLQKSSNNADDMLQQKWTGLAQHIAFYLHSNTAIAVLTFLTNLKMVAVYSVYYMVTSNIQNLTSSFSNGMEALFGDMLAKEETQELEKSFSMYDTMISVVSVVLFAVTAVLIVPFVKIYTADLTDANYIAPTFALILVLASLTFCLRLPYHSIVIAAGHFKQTRMAAYGEAAINIVLSVLLASSQGLVGVALATFIATIFRFIYYAVYISQNILKQKAGRTIKREIINYLSFLGVYIIGRCIQNYMPTNNYFSWVLCGIVVTLMAVCIVVVANYLFYREECKKLLHIRKK